VGEHAPYIYAASEMDESRIPTRGSWSYHQIMDGILRGQIRGLWVVCTNTAHSWINQNQARDILDRLDFLVVQDMCHSTETARTADLVLPAAGWGEKEGTFINSERRIGVVQKVREAPGQALSDFRIFRLIAHYWGCGEMFTRWDSPEAAFKLLRECSRGMPCDITGVTDYAQIDQCRGIQWPLSSDEALSETERRLFADGKFFHPDARAKFLFEPPRPLTEPTTPEYPFILLTGRGSASQWHTQTRMGKSAVLRKLYPQEPFVEINPTDARRLGISQGEQVTISSQRGQMTALAFLTHNVAAGQVFIPMHYEPTNRLTDAVFDPYSHQPSYKACAVTVHRRQK